jgi:transcriptional regulator with XRE-family HTH domain
MIGRMAPLDLERVGELVRTRRGVLGLTQQQLAEKAGIDTGTISSLELGQTWPWAKNRSRIDQALGWRPGSLEEVRHGGEPTLVDEPQQVSARYIDPAEQHIMDTPGMTDQERSAMIAVYRSLRAGSERRTG